jgi:serine/threonine protein phosphatase 1
MPARAIATGDIHGCPDALAAILDVVAPGRDDTVVTLGDYIDRGPHSRGVIDQLVRLTGRCRLVTLMGNHEEALFRARLRNATGLPVAFVATLRARKPSAPLSLRG